LRFSPKRQDGSAQIFFRV